MKRPHALTVPLAVGLGFGCSLLQGYPGGEDPGKALAGGDGNTGRFEGEDADGDGLPDPIDGNAPLVDPAIDASIRILLYPDRFPGEMGCPGDDTDVRRLAFPGDALTVGFRFCSDEMNVVGGGIRFPGSNEVQWTFIEGADQFSSSVVDFAYVIADSVCEDVPSLCHSLDTEVFAVARNTKGDVDGDGEQDGQFVVSAPQTLEAILMCATCESPSCDALFPDGSDPSCARCGQPPSCQDYFDLCLDPDLFDNLDREDVEVFDNFFGVDGILWKTQSTCDAGRDQCLAAVENFNVTGSCSLGGGGEMTGGSDSGGGVTTGGM
jgi:hypothetical protein